MHFWGDYISAHMGCCALKLLHVLEIDQGYLAQGPPQKYRSAKKRLNFGAISDNFRYIHVPISGQ